MVPSLPKEDTLRPKNGMDSSLSENGTTLEPPVENAIRQRTNTRESPLLTPVIWCILVTETGERFAYFGFRAILVLYFTMELEFSDNQAIAFFAYVTCLAYLSPLLGALLADGHLGRYTTILYFGVVYVIGLIVLTFAAWAAPTLQIERLLTFIGLFLVCLGTGGIKPCVSAFGADQVAMRLRSDSQQSLPDSSSREEDETDNRHFHQEEPPIDPRETTVVQEASQAEQVRAFFAYFYFCINVGAVTSIALVPILRGHVGFGAAFLLPTLFMITAMLLFLSKRHEYVHHEPGQDGSSLLTTFRLCIWLIRHHLWSSSIATIRWLACGDPGEMPKARRRGQHSLLPSEENGADADVLASDDSSHDDIMNQQLDDAAQALHVLPIMAMFPIFWCLYDQQSSVWTLQATRMELNGLQPEQLNVVNPVEIMIFIPLFDRIIYPAMQAAGWNIAPLRRMGWGMLLTALSFFVSGLVESTIQYRERNNLDQVNVFWQLPQITLLAVGEIFLSVTGLEFAYSTSPDRLKAFLMALFLLTTAVGDFFSGILYSTVFADLNRATVMHICAGLMLCNLGLFKLVAHWWERNNFQDLRRTPSMQGLEFQERRIV